MSERHEYVTGFEKGLAIIEAFSNENPSLTISEAADLTGQSRAAARRYLLTLLALGYVRQEKNQFYLTARVLRLSGAYIESDALVREAQHVLDQLSHQFAESTSIGVLDATDVVFIARSTTKRILAIEIGVGTKLPAYCSSMGRVLMAYEERDRVKDLLKKMTLKALTPYTLTKINSIEKEIQKVINSGYSLSDQEIELGLRSLAVPVLNRRGQCIAAMSVSTQTGRMSAKDMLENFLPKLQEASKKLARAMNI